MRIAITANGPGEVAGWVRPLVRRLYEFAPETIVHVFLVPDDYASGHEARVLRGWFPHMHVHEPREYLAFALGRTVAGVPAGADVVQYLGGDMMHAARLHRKLGGIAATYKFSRSGYRDLFARAFAVDERNARQLAGWHIPRERIEIVGNLAIDGALLDAEAVVEPRAPEDGVLFLPGSRPHFVEHMVPFFFTTARRMLRESPGLRLAFGISPFTSIDTLRNAIERGADPRMWAERGCLSESGDDVFLESADGAIRIPIVRNVMSAARRARLIVTIPGTNAIELAAIGKPMIVCSPLNIPEVVPINGPLTYLDRIPLIGVPLKRSVVTAVSKRFPFHAQPNIDLNEMVVCELHGTLSPGRVARVALERYDDVQWLRATSERLKELYAGHAGASERMAKELLRL